MLHNPKWDRTPTLVGFADWLETQPADKVYNFHCRECALGKYLGSLNITYDRDWSTANREIDSNWNTFITMPTPRTYGAAAIRARQMIPGY